MSITIILVVITGFISYKGFEYQSFFNKYMHNPYRVHHYKEYYRMLSSGFLHGSWLHLLINLFVFHEFGRLVEYKFLSKYGSLTGAILYLVFYLLAIVVSDFRSLKKHQNNPSFSSIGASGAVSAILFVYIFFEPWSILLLYFVIPMPAIIGGILYLWYSSYAAKNMQDRIDHDAHFAGAIFGFLAALILFSDSVQIFLSKLLQGPDFAGIGF